MKMTWAKAGNGILVGMCISLVVGIIVTWDEMECADNLGRLKLSDACIADENCMLNMRERNSAERYKRQVAKYCKPED